MSLKAKTSNTVQHTQTGRCKHRAKWFVTTLGWFSLSCSFCFSCSSFFLSFSLHPPRTWNSRKPTKFIFFSFSTVVFFLFVFFTLFDNPSLRWKIGALFVYFASDAKRCCEDGGGISAFSISPPIWRERERVGGGEGDFFMQKKRKNKQGKGGGIWRRRRRR